MTAGSQANSEAFIVAGHKATITLDDMAFKCELSDRTNGRAQTLLYGTFKGKAYKTSGIPCNITRLTSPGKFPLGNFRVVVKVDTTGTYYAVFNHSTNRLLLYTALGTQVDDGTDISTLLFPFVAVGE
jgi:hypothetical protein